MKSMTTRLAVAVFIGTVLIFSNLQSAHAGDVVIIGHKNLPVDSLGREEVKKIFLGKKTKWNKNLKITIVTLQTPETHKSFLKDYIRKTPSQFNIYWKKMIFTGKGRTPKSFETAEQILDFVAATKGAMSYIPMGTDNNKVKIINTFIKRK
ncbi:MAG: hypothetical protein GY749_18910 [Desulfobacteraceae bacterium]|nr:hypothetical protein [Desulfobacteraceae bacterium]